MVTLPHLFASTSMTVPFPTLIIGVCHGASISNPPWCLVPRPPATCSPRYPKQEFTLLLYRAGHVMNCGFAVYSPSPFSARFSVYVVFLSTTVFSFMIVAVVSIPDILRCRQLPKRNVLIGIVVLYLISGIFSVADFPVKNEAIVNA